VRVLIFHGYLLRGTGSNVYNARLAAALVGLGHEVHLLCQERHADELDFVGAVGDWDSGQLRLKRTGRKRCTVYRPPLELLPVYVPDRYEGVEARPFPELSDEELESYVEINARAVAEVLARTHPDVALANHLIMGPAILARALKGTGISYAVTLHGSALEYTVKPHPRFLPWAREGLASAKGVLVGSRHTAESLWSALADPSLPARTRLGPPGVDIGAFRALPPHEARRELAALAEALEVRTLAEHIDPRQGSDVAAPQTAPSAFERDDAATAAVLQALAELPGETRLVAFVGKLIPAKGIDLLLRAWPAVLAEFSEARLVVVGFGSWEEEAHELARSSGAEHSIIFAGRLEHGELQALLPLCEALVVPSTFPESFGMVAAEAAACGALPISAAHSGLAEVSRTLAASLPEPVGELLSFELGPGAVDAIAEKLVRWLRMPTEVRLAARTQLAQGVAENYTWESVARRVLAAARGRLDRLPSPSRPEPTEGE
jgi:glycosyltransferase involved in cell wall biosynthesis